MVVFILLLLVVHTYITNYTFFNITPFVLNYIIFICVILRQKELKF